MVRGLDVIGNLNKKGLNMCLLDLVFIRFLVVFVDYSFSRVEWRWGGGELNVSKIMNRSLGS